LLVEDETLIRMMIADMVEELGHTIVAEAGNMTEALALAQTADFEIAVLDINVGGAKIEPVADVIAGRRLPFIFASGYGAGSPKNFETGQLCKNHSLKSGSGRRSKKLSGKATGATSQLSLQLPDHPNADRLCGACLSKIVWVINGS
jgi:CheY-like chemotaxis protein